MTPRRRRLLRWMAAYVAVLCMCVPVALPAWNGFLSESVGRVLSIEQIHMIQYEGLGALGGLFARAGVGARWVAGGVFILVSLIGLGDELVQGALPGRFFDWADVRLNALSALVGMVGMMGMAWTVVCMRRMVMR